MFEKLGVPGAPATVRVENVAELTGPVPPALMACTATVYEVAEVKPLRFAVSTVPVLVHAPAFTLYS
jgi:hypothetical protein